MLWTCLTWQKSSKRSIRSKLRRAVASSDLLSLGTSRGSAHLAERTLPPTLPTTQAELAAEQKKQEAARQLQEQRAAAAAAAATRAVPSHLALPEFYLAADCEPAPDDAPAVLDKASKRALELLEEYQQRQARRRRSRGALRLASSTMLPRL